MAGVLGAGGGVLTVLFGCYMTGILGARRVYLQCYLVVTWRVSFVLEVVHTYSAIWLLYGGYPWCWKWCILTVLLGCYMAGILGAGSGVLTVFLVVTWWVSLVLEGVYLQCCLVVTWRVSLVLEVVHTYSAIWLLHDGYHWC